MSKRAAKCPGCPGRNAPGCEHPMCVWQIQHAERQREEKTSKDSEAIAALKIAVRLIAELHGLKGWLFFCTKHPAMKQIDAVLSPRRRRTKP